MRVIMELFMTACLVVKSVLVTIKHREDDELQRCGICLVKDSWLNIHDENLLALWIWLRSNNWWIVRENGRYGYLNLNKFVKPVPS